MNLELRTKDGDCILSYRNRQGHSGKELERDENEGQSALRPRRVWRSRRKAADWIPRSQEERVSEEEGRAL